MLRRFVLLATLAACGDNNVGLTLEDFDETIAQARCDRFVRCGLFADDATCAGYFRKRPDVDLEAALAAGAVRYHGPSAEACVAALAESPCDETSREVRVPPLACAEMFIGTIKIGEACQLDEECISGACEIPFCEMLCCPGTCLTRRATVAIDEPCTRDDECVDDSSCNDAGVCAELGGEGDLCRSDHDCIYGSGCIGPSELMPGNCRKLGAIGEACPYMRCSELGAVCQGGNCVPVGLPGDPCASASNCSPFALCDQPAAKCIAVPSLGEPCTSRCAGESFCERVVTNSCVEPYENGTSCSFDDQCASLECLEGEFRNVCRDRSVCF